MEEIGRQRVYSKYTSELPWEVEEGSWTSTEHNRTVSRKESVQIINARGDQISVHMFGCDEFPFSFWVDRKWVARGWYFLLHTTHKFVQMKRNVVQSKYVHWKGYKFFAILFSMSERFWTAKKANCSQHGTLQQCFSLCWALKFQSCQHWIWWNDLILQHTNLYHPIAQNKRISAPHLNPCLPLPLTPDAS